MNKGIKIIVLVMLLVALINQIVGDNLLITLGLLWFAHTLRYIDDSKE
jgi:hypothetical protein